MVLADLGSKLTTALRNMRNSTLVDQEAVNNLLKEIGNALLAADVNQKLVIQLKVNIQRTINAKANQSGVNKRQLTEKAVVYELGQLLDSGTSKPRFQPKKGQSNVFMFVGLQGAGKTTTVTKMAYYYKRKGQSTSIVCADTFRAGAFDQLRQNATKAGVPFFGSYTEPDPVKVAIDGVERFRSDKTEIIIVDTSGRHKQEDALFEEMRSISKHIEPDSTVFVMDSTIGQAARDQAQAFSDAVEVGSVIITKLDGHAKGGGALSAVAATNSPIIFIGTGEHIDKFEKFNTASFVSRLLGKQDVAGIMDLWNDVKHGINEPEMMGRLMEGKFSLRDMRDQFVTILNMGPNLMNMIPGLNKLIPPDGEQNSHKRIKQFLTVMDSMTDKELDSDPKILNYSRMYRIAHGSGLPVQIVCELVAAYKPFQKMGGKLGQLAQNVGGGDLKNVSAEKLASALDSRTLNSLGGQVGLRNLMKQMKDMEMDPEKMQEMMMNKLGSGVGNLANMANFGKRGRRRMR